MNNIRRKEKREENRKKNEKIRMNTRERKNWDEYKKD